MKLATICIGIMVSMVSIREATFAAEETATQDSQQATVLLSQNPDIDHERDKFFEIHYTISPTPETIKSTFKNNIRCILLEEANKAIPESSNLSSDETPKTRVFNSLSNNQEYYSKHILLKAGTVYTLPHAFESGYLFSPKQVTHALKKLDIDSKFLKEIDRDKFWVFSVRCLELPPSKLDNDKDVLNTYLCSVNKLISIFNLRLKEDEFALLGFTDLTSNITSQNIIHNDQNKNIISKFMRGSYNNNERSIEQSIIKRIVEKRKYKKLDGLDELLASIGPLNIFQSLCNGMDGGRALSVNPGEYLSVSVRVAEKLSENNKSDITPEVLETIQNILVRTFNVFVLEAIKENIEKSMMPVSKGFSSKLPEGFI